MKFSHCTIASLVTLAVCPLNSKAFVPSWQSRMNTPLYSTDEGTSLDTKTLDSVAVSASPQETKTTSATPIMSDIDIDVACSYATPAEYENEKFQLDSSVSFWREYNRDNKMKTDDYIQVISEVTNRLTSKGGNALSYWLRHNARTGYFLTNAALGTVASQLHERFVSQRELKNGSIGSLASQPDTIPRLVAEVALSYEQDYSNIENGNYKEPFDMYTRNQQNNPFFIGRQTSRFISEAIGTIARQNRGSEQDKVNWLANEDGEKFSKNDFYPDYYKTAFHYQTDGWMSQTSADVYETSTETLFLGRQDAMQRTALAPLAEFSREFRKKSSRPMKVLEVACGTGRFMTFVRDNLPLDTQCTAVDLSPFYLDKARTNDKLWKSKKTRDEKEIISPLRVVQAKAEDLPFLDEEFDAVVCMYLYHEIPRDIRAQVSAEMARVTAKGGRVILTDSYQKGDRPVYDKTMGNFGNLNEPYYNDYIEDFLPRHFENVGMNCLTKSLRSTTKTLVFEKAL